ncbi:MAG: ribosome biogenesis GTPase Der, partial [Chloroflexota bacterium]
IPVSAYHGTGIGDLMSAVVLPMSPMPPREEEALLRTAIVGRPNVGKSMLLNAILGEERVIVSETPGTTRDTIDTTFEYSGESMVLVDTAGIRRRGRIEGGVEQYSVLRAMQAVSRADVALLVLDASELVTAQDTHIAGYIVQALKGVVVVVNKWDLIRDLGLDAGKCAEEIRYKLKFISYAPVVYVSALLGEGVGGVLGEVKAVFQERCKRINTSKLNEVVSQAVLAHSPSRIRGRRLKVLYVTQTGINPPTFVFSVNDPRLLHFSYHRYLENRLRDAFGFRGTPLRFIFNRRSE